MSNTKFPFLFGDAEIASSKDFSVVLPLGIKDKSTLLSVYAKAGHFPGYFGNNWDALSDCLRDFSWTIQKRIIITHKDLPLAANRKELSVYLDILAGAVRFWKSEEIHELLAVFPTTSKVIIDRLLELD